MKQLHPIQLWVLTKLLFAPQLSYSDIKPSDDIWGNQFSFHLHQLEELWYIIKGESGWQLTLIGKEYANRISDETQKIEKLPKVSVLLWCTRDGVAGLELLIYTRFKHPFYGKQWLFGGKVKYGETIEQAAERELYEETGYVGQATLVGVKHYLVYSATTEQLLEDKYMRVCSVNNPHWEFVPCDEWEYQRIPVSELGTQITNHFNVDDFEELVWWILWSHDSMHFSQVQEYTSDF